MKTGFSRAGSRRASRIRRDIAADWRRWTTRERIAAGMLAVLLGTGTPAAYVALAFHAGL